MLFSGKSKHRRPSKAARFAAFAGITGAAVAAPLLGATSASAATAAEWEKVAQCESGGNWSINTGNGYYGGLQFSASTWAAYGGTAYAATADQASKSQQIEIAEKVLAGQGKGAWPHCGVGLSSAAYQGGGEQAQPQPQQERAAEQPTTRSEQRTAPKAEKKAAPKTVTTPTGKKVEKGDGEYKVKAGDTLSTIATAKKVAGGWEKLFELNKDIVDDADLIYPGQQLHLS
ncbi:LysM peptidoglycan-binding domain-containing protein [Streptomyces sp. WAC05374]|uniref:LysM peptidoglycan-binding domain-containing protein n=1 Tax=Streptomyces sp. WAC05374 TaxID=2487420 RepID=UPI000F86C1AF|nr:transglycosylase family protein [Streptomyces sp. WAC05374]RST12841.1 LysM peptidoglycan-binding domain-containing protein [Streptomyces sp. WAC05374]TDF47005.1 LysM peptidoglycan-binding domain-containing protein [Streptomyces sp. WAC05374]TDF57260.1 LysM peptidoglycan-binding domain-containing protein [Streptomyces sp. WAC05374]TDF61363.1 LysM peptidoglycan-binding domain-containing protein [Streptomyces sp. WAC05374]